MKEDWQQVRAASSGSVGTSQRSVLLLISGVFVLFLQLYLCSGLCLTRWSVTRLQNCSLTGHWVTHKKSSSVGKWGVGWTVCETSGCSVEQWGKHSYRSIQEQWEYKIPILSWSSCDAPHWTNRKKGKVSDKIFMCVFCCLFQIITLLKKLKKTQLVRAIGEGFPLMEE